MEDKGHYLAMLRAELGRWEGLLAGLSEAQAEAPALEDGWSVKDVVAHLRAWQQRSVARMEAAAEGREPVFPAWPADLDPEPHGQPHEVNAWIRAERRGLPWAQVRGEWLGGFRRLVALAEAAPEADLLAPGRYAWLEGGVPLAFILQASCEHHAEHWGFLMPQMGRVRAAG